MTPTQVFLVIFGWLILLLLSNRSLRRTEISRLKDKIIDNLQSLCDWYKMESECDQPLKVEEYISAKITQIELRIQQFNNYCESTVISPDPLQKIREFDTTKKIPKSDKAYDFFSICSDLIEHVEVSYDMQFYRKSWIKRVLKPTHEETIVIILFVISTLVILVAKAYLSTI